MTRQMDHPVKAAIIRSGSIGTDLLIKALRRARFIEVVAMVGIDPASDGRRRVVGGQQDMIVDVALDLLRAREGPHAEPVPTSSAAG
jgi:acetaldehyde dehydrogenase (acetylating)